MTTIRALACILAVLSLLETFTVILEAPALGTFAAVLVPVSRNVGRLVSILIIVAAVSA